MLNISKGIVLRPQKVVVYGPEGIGKSTFASHFPDPLFLDIEDSTSQLDVKRIPDINSWAMRANDELRAYMNQKKGGTSHA